MLREPVDQPGGFRPIITRHGQSVARRKAGLGEGAIARLGDQQITRRQQVDVVPAETLGRNDRRCLDRGLREHHRTPARRQLPARSIEGHRQPAEGNHHDPLCCRHAEGLAQPGTIGAPTAGDRRRPHPPLESIERHTRYQREQTIGFRIGLPHRFGDRHHISSTMRP